MEASDMLDQWMRTYDKKLLRLAYAYTRNWASAQDAVQNSFVKAYLTMDRLRDKENPIPWLCRILINECISAKRLGWRELSTFSPPESTVCSAEDTLVENDESKRLHDSILRLPERLRIPIILYYFNDFSIDQIAAITGVRPGTVKSRLSRARNRLKVTVLRGETDAI